MNAAASHLEKVQVCTFSPSQFEAQDGRYRLTVEGGTVVFEVDFLRREAHQLKGELLVRCAIPGARTVDDVLAVADMNLSSTQARERHAKYLAERSGAADFPWSDYVEEFAQRTIAAERQGKPAVMLRNVPRPEPGRAVEELGLVLRLRHPLILFGDGGSVKSTIALYLAGLLARRGFTVAYFDWELDEGEHRLNLEKLFGDAMPKLLYARCERALVHEAERLRRIVRQEGVDFAVYDSIAFACDGPPEAAEVAVRYHQAVRQINVGSLHVAHITKGEHGDQKPFGSAFWHNMARDTWNAKKAESAPHDPIANVALHHRKHNLSAQRPAVGLEINFAGDRTHVRKVDVGDVPELAAGLSIRQRMEIALRRGPLTLDSLADELEEKRDSVRKAASRHPATFTLLDGGRVSLLETRR